MPSRSDTYASVSSLAGLSSTRKWVDFVSLTKPRINVLVGVVTLAGFYLAGADSFDFLLLVHTLLGTILVGSGASVLNQVWEWRSDAVMTRTRNRPISAGRIRPGEGCFFGLVLLVVGVFYLQLLTTTTAAFVAAVTAVLYVLVYTPLKSRTTAATAIGAIPGGLPTLIGWTAAGGVIDVRAWTLFAILFLWQLPHFLAISWNHRDDYRKAGIVNVAVLDSAGRSCSSQALFYSILLFPVSLLPSLFDLTGTVYFYGAFVLGCVFIGYCCLFVRSTTVRTARGLFWYSIFYLPVLYLLMMVDRI